VTAIGVGVVAFKVFLVPKVVSLVEVCVVVVTGNTVRKTAVVTPGINVLATSTGLVVPKAVQANLCSELTIVACNVEAATIAC
jgi:hypothetical protein